MRTATITEVKNQLSSFLDRVRQGESVEAERTSERGQGAARRAAERPVRFWDSSALLPLLVDDALTHGAMRELEHDPDMLVWWSAEVECASALCRLERDGALSASDVSEALARLDALAAAWQVIQPVQRLRAVAVRLQRTHPLRAADALQLAAAIEASEQQPRTLPLVTLDERFARAAEREGFPVVSPGWG
jgi:predicted nucleic acid-binding protein